MHPTSHLVMQFLKKQMRWDPAKGVKGSQIMYACILYQAHTLTTYRPLKVIA